MKYILQILLFTSIFLFVGAVAAQAPNGINYQAVIRNNTGTLMANTPTAIRVSIRQTTATGTIVYSERQNVTTDQFGLVNFVIGSGTLLSGNFTNIPWGNGPFFLDLGVAFSGLPAPITYMPYGTQQMMSVPYALYAKSSGNLVNQWSYGTSAPTSGLGNVGDYYLETTTGNVYTKTNGTTWVLISNITGPQGPAGATGATGLQGPAGVAGPQGPIGLTGATGAAGPQGIQGIQGPAGANGTNGTNGTAVLNGITNPVVGTGVNGDFYINTATNTLFGPKANGAWPAGVSLVGPQGIQGIQGVAGPQGATGLTGAAGATGATGLQGPAGVAGAAGPQGPQGIQGPAGANGTNGTNGTAVLNGTTNPAAGTGVNGDFYINTATNTLFGPKANGAWPTGVSLIGPQGPIGLTGPQGPAGPTGATGLTGAAGTNGTNGTNGTSVLNGIINPVAGTGVNGDFYINTATNTLFGPKANGAWPAGVSLVGPQGIQGIQGVAGPTGVTGPAGANGTNGTNGTAVLNGITNPVAGTGVNGDFYINTATNELFGPKANGAWPAGVSLIGPQGLPGNNNNYYTKPSLGGVSGIHLSHPGWGNPSNGFAANIIPQSYLHYFPIYIWKPTTFSGYSIYLISLSNTTGAVLRTGIYSFNNSNGQPDQLLFDLGTISLTNSTGLRTVNLTFTLTPGYYFIAYCSSSNNGGSLMSYLTKSATSPVSTRYPEFEIVPNNSPSQSALRGTTSYSPSSPLPNSISNSEIFTYHNIASPVFLRE